MTKTSHGHGGRRPGAGRKVGYRSPGTLKKLIARERYRERFLAEADDLITAQFTVAKGSIVMFGRSGKDWIRITDPDQMLKCLQIGDSCYRLVAKDPDSRTLKDIFDREFGRPQESREHTGAGGGPIQIIHEYRYSAASNKSLPGAPEQQHESSVS